MALAWSAEFAWDLCRLFNLCSVSFCCSPRAFGQRRRELGPKLGSSDHIDPRDNHEDSDISAAPASAALSVLLSCSTPLTAPSLRGAQQTQCRGALHAGTSLPVLSRHCHSWPLLLAAGCASLCTAEAMAVQPVVWAGLH